VLDATTGLLVKDIPVGPGPNGLAYDPRRGELLVADIGGDHSVRLLSPRDGTTRWTTAMPGRPRWPCLDAAGERYFVAIRDPAVVVGMDARSGSITATWPISTSGPHGLDIDPERRRLFVSCDGGSVVVLDLADGTEIASVAIAGGADVTWYNGRLARLYVSIPKPGVVDVLDCTAMRVAEQISAEPGTRGSAFDPDRQRLYVFLAKSGRIAVYDEAS
jgi:DNA-binding beta-propeller fold protein YncE